MLPEVGIPVGHQSLCEFSSLPIIHALPSLCADYSVCQTIHRVNVETGATVQVSKRCALSSECSTTMIGCHNTHINGIQVRRLHGNNAGHRA